MATPEARSVLESLVQNVDGFILPSQGFKPEVFRQILRLPVRPGDVLLSTYPKCGTTWAQYIIWELLNDGRPPPSGNQLMFKDFPFLEMTGPEPFLNLPEPRIGKLHLPYDMVPKCEGCRLIHVIRNPFDVSVSMWHHICQIDAAKLGVHLPFDDFFETFIDGTCMCGDYFKHEMSWFAHRNDPNVLYLRYESMKRDPRSAVLRIANFLDKGQELSQDGGRLLDDVLKHTSFAYVKENCTFKVGVKDSATLDKMGKDYSKLHLDQNALNDQQQFRNVNFFRKGKVGSSREELSSDQWRRLEQAVQERVADQELRSFMLDTGN